MVYVSKHIGFPFRAEISLKVNESDKKMNITELIFNTIEMELILQLKMYGSANMQLLFFAKL